MLDAWHAMLDARCWIRDAQRQSSSLERRILSPGSAGC